MSASFYYEKVAEILGVTPINGTFDLKFSINNEQDAKQAILRIKLMSKELKLLKKELSAVITEAKAIFSGQRSRVGHNVGSALEGIFLGYRFESHHNALKRAQLKRKQIEVLEPYLRAKGVIDNALGQLDILKSKIDLFSEGQKNKIVPRVVSPPPFESGAKLVKNLSLPPLPSEKASYYLFVNNEAKGLYAPSEVTKLIQDGSIDYDTFCCCAGDTEWKSVKDFPELLK